MDDNISLEKQRLHKLQTIQKMGINTYPATFNKGNSIIDILNIYFKKNELLKEAEVKIAGRIATKRPMGKAGFLNLYDESGNLQIYANDKTLDEISYTIFNNLDIGDIIGVEGDVFVTKKGEPSIRAKKITLLAKNLHPLPIVKEKDGVVYDTFEDKEMRYRQRYIDLLTNKDVSQNFVLRSKIIQAIRNFFIERNFLEVETPMLQNVASGAVARPFKTHHNTLDMSLYLRIAPELSLKKLIIGGFERIFEVNKSFRNEGISPQHNPEFTMLEVYQAYANYFDMMQLLEDLLTKLISEFLDSPTLTFKEHSIAFKPPFAKKSYITLIEDALSEDLSPWLKNPSRDFKSLLDKVQERGLNIDEVKTVWELLDYCFSELVEPYLIQPTFVIDYPKAISPLAKANTKEPTLSERFEFYIAGNEIANAYSELNDPLEQQKRFEDQKQQKNSGAKEVLETDDDFINALKVGMPPTAGLGIGIDRLIMLLLNKPSIKDVILFPLLRKKN